MIHPAYIKFLRNANISESATGYNIAIVEVCDLNNKLRSIESLEMRLFHSKVTDIMHIKVLGYPGEKKLRGMYC